MKEEKTKKKRSLLNKLTLVSFILLCLTGFLFYLSYRINAWEESFSLRDDFHISLYRKGNDCRLAFFNVKNYPYTGSVVTHDTKIRGFGDFLGIYYRHLSSVEEERKGEDIWWTLYISLWWLVVLFSILPSLFLYKRFISEQKTS